MPLIRNIFNDLVNGIAYTEVGSLAVVDHPRILYPKQTIFQLPEPSDFAPSSIFGPKIQTI